MDPERWRRAFDLFQATIARDAGERAAFLADACLGDEAIREAVEQLVHAHESAGDFLEVPAAVRVLAGDDQPIGRGAAPPPTLARVNLPGRSVSRSACPRRGRHGHRLRSARPHPRPDRRAEDAAARRPGGFYRLKREFRSLADVAHRNLVSLYELFVEGAHCFFTMELVNGVNLVDYVRGSPAATASLRVDRLRRAFQQLAEGLSELHRHGKLHRDIKPSNVLVTPEGRVVILDFGLIADVVPDTMAASERVRRARRPTFRPRSISRRARHARPAIGTASASRCIRR